MATLARMWVAIVAVIASAGLPAAACAHAGGAGPREQALLEAEAAALGADHAREHQLQREALRQWLAKAPVDRARLDADCRLYLEVARQLAEHPEDEEIYANFKRVMDVYDDALTDWGQFHPGRLHTR